MLRGIQNEKSAAVSVTAKQTTLNQTEEQTSGSWHVCVQNAKFSE
jgi:hypothetical protein